YNYFHKMMYIQMYIRYYTLLLPNFPYMIEYMLPNKYYHRKIHNYFDNNFLLLFFCMTKKGFH
ncbi:MAG: hypothetical protein Q4F69_05755, partial [Bacteroidia bacterium]|nr:hypothetical protein [Bacteroidia bacterium]